MKGEQVLKTLKRNTALYKYIIPGLLFTCFLFSCDNLKSLEENEPVTEKTWVNITIRYDSNNGFQFYYYFGQIEESLCDKISKNIIEKGFIKIDNLRYWNDDDKIEVYEDETEPGIKIFRIEDIRKMSVLKGDPVVTYKKVSLSEKSLKVRSEMGSVELDTTAVEDTLGIEDTASVD